MEKYKITVQNNKLKIIAPTWNDDSELPDSFYSVTVIQDYIEFIIRKLEKLPTNPPIHIYMNKISNILIK